MVRSFGAPVIDPAGNSVRNAPTALAALAAEV